MDLGGHLFGGKTIYACDWHKASRQFFKNNFADVPFDQCDMRLVTLERINTIRVNLNLQPLSRGELDIIIAGSPCVKLSAANTYDARDFAAENLLMVETLPGIVRDLQPKIAWFENSDRLLSKARSALFLEYTSSIKSLLPNYECKIRVINAPRFGGYQTRSRAMTVLVRKDVLAGRRISFFPKPQRIDLLKQGAHVLLPHIKAFWAGQFEEKYRSTFGNIFCTLTASGGEMVKDHFDNFRPLDLQERKILTRMEEHDYSNICKTDQIMLLGNMVLRQVSEAMFRHFYNVILKH